MNGFMLMRAFDLMRPWVEELENDEYENRLTSLRKCYQGVTDYFLQGKDDSQRQEHLQAIARDGWKLLDEVYLEKRKREGTTMEWVEMLRPLNGYQSPEEAFRYFWLKKIEQADCEALLALAADPEMEDEAMMGVSGLMLNVHRSFSEEGVMCLIEAANERYAEVIRERAWVGLVIVLVAHDLHLTAYPNIQEAIVELTSTDDGRVYAINILSCLLRTAGIAWVEKTYNKVQADLVPLTTKLMHEQKNVNIINIADLEAFEDQMAEELMDSLRYHQQEMVKMHELRMDLHFAMMKDMYRTPFFKDPYRWWLPFAPDYLPDNMKQGEKLLSMMPADDMCDSDKYAFISSIMQVGHINGMKLDEVQPQETPQSTYNDRLLANDYVRQTYRFFVLNPWHIEWPINDLFCKNHIFEWLCPSASEKGILAGQCLSFHAWNMASLLCQMVLNTTESAQMEANLGYSLQQRGMYSPAIEHYKQSLRIEDDARTWRRLAVCYLRDDQYDEALLVLNRLLENAPDNKALLMEKAKCLENLELYTEALDTYFKLDLYHPGWDNVERAVAWCSVLADDHETALTYYRKLEEAGRLKCEDHMGLGHLHFIRGNRMQAYWHYQEAKSLADDFMSFIRQFRYGRQMLMEKGVSLEDIYMIEDLLLSL